MLIVPAYSARTTRSSRHARVFTGVALVVGFLILSACGAMRVGYNHAESVTLLWANRYVSLDADQEAIVRRGIAEFMAWHRTTQLPDYAAFLGDVERRVQGNVTAADMANLESQGRDRGQRAIEHMLPALADLALSLRSDQLTKMEHKFASNDDDYRSDYVDVTPARRKKNLFTKQMDHIEYWYGSFSDAQRATLRAASEAQPVDTQLWLAERQAREQELVAMLRKIADTKPPRDVVIGLLRAYALRVQSSPLPERKRYIDTLDRSNQSFYAAAANLATPKQRANAVETLQGWVTDLTGLSKQSS